MKTLLGMNSQKMKRITLIALAVALCAQIHFNYLAPGFIITFSVVILPIFFYFNDDLNPFLIAAGVALASPLFRGFTLLVSGGDPHDVIAQYVLTDVAFYLVYGGLYFFLYWHRTERNASLFFCVILLCDYLANFVEISILQNWTDYSIPLFRTLFITALIRALISSICIVIYNYLHLFLRKEDHEKQYYYFLWSASLVKSEVYFMEKNISEIEAIMKNAYMLNKELTKLAPNSDYAQTALQIARDVHEVKKDYQNVVRGLGQYYQTEGEGVLRLSGVLKVVLSHARNHIRLQSLDIIISSQIQVDPPIRNHYQVVSILSNLIFNAVEALEASSAGMIQIAAYDAGDSMAISVTDNGPGMSEDLMNLIFEPGFSTKFNHETGDIYRGIGLSQVKTLVEDEFKGWIEVHSRVYEQTRFTVYFNKNYL